MMKGKLEAKSKQLKIAMTGSRYEYFKIFSSSKEAKIAEGRKHFHFLRCSRKSDRNEKTKN
jgi:hypothetical protein